VNRPVIAACERPPVSVARSGAPTLAPHVEARIAALAPDQRAAATAPPGPILCVAPAGSGKTTTLVARIAWLVATGSSPDEICALTFNRRAADELDARLHAALGPHAAGSVRSRTFHALGREILREAAEPVEPLVDRAAVIEAVLGRVPSPAEFRFLDDAFSRLKLDSPSAGVTDPRSAAQPFGSAVLELFESYERHLAAARALDFDDLVRRAVMVLERDSGQLERWRRRTLDLLVDEVQDVDRTQLRLALLLAAPANRIFLVGDDDQTIYAWRLADVRRVLGLAAALPGLRQVYLETNYRCPAPVVERAVRLASQNEERFPKTIRARPTAPGHLILAADSGDDVARARRLLAVWPPPGAAASAILARTNAELAPFAAVALELGIPYRCDEDGLVLDDPLVDRIVRCAERDKAAAGSALPSARTALPAVGRTLADAALDGAGPMPAEPLTGNTLLCWAAGHDTVGDLLGAIARARQRRAELHREDASLTLATVHTTKGLEFDHVACIGLDEGRFPNRRSLQDARDPERALEEERRLAYVAWTRARRSLLLLYDPATPSPFLRDAFDADELDPHSERYQR
jgi:DNA helicase-2/ATP-dependent DNA helicase PcrA